MIGSTYPKVSFESSVNPEGIQTGTECATRRLWFESSVNPEGIQTSEPMAEDERSLRAV